MRLGGDLQRPDQWDRPADRDLHVVPARQLQHRPRVPLDLVDLDVAADTRDREQLGVVAGGRVQDREAVVDAGVHVEEQRRAGGHRHRC
jgi:hypothetical protein